MEKVVFKRVFNVFILLLISFFLISCQKQNNTLKQTEEFYVNDNANALLNATKWTILNYSVELYNDSLESIYKHNNIDGTQVVVLTYVGEVGDIITTDIFNSWGIGKNDMGLFIVLFFEKDDKDFINTDIVVEIGTNLTEYLTAFHATNLVDEYFYNSSISNTNYDLRLISLYFALLEYIYLNVYNYDTYNYESYLNEYLINQYEYFGLLPSEKNKNSFKMPTWAIILSIALVVFGSSSVIIPISIGRNNTRFTGDGGKSRGYWFRK